MDAPNYLTKLTLSIAEVEIHIHVTRTIIGPIFKSIVNEANEDL